MRAQRGDHGPIGRGVAQDAPSPCRTSTRPCTSSTTSAWRIDARLTPSCADSSRSGGSFCPGRSPISRISVSSRSTSCSYSRDRSIGRNAEYRDPPWLAVTTPPPHP